MNAARYADAGEIYFCRHPQYAFYDVAPLLPASSRPRRPRRPRCPRCGRFNAHAPPLARRTYPYTSKMPAAPMPPPMHIVTIP